MGPGDSPLYLYSAPSYRNIQNMPFERCCSSCCAGVRSNTACSARCSTASSELTAHQPSNLNASTAPPLLKPECQYCSTSQLVFAILRKRFCLTASDCCLQMHWSWKCALVPWSLHCVRVYEFRCRCLSPVLPPQQDKFGARTGSVGRQVCTSAPGLPDCQASSCAQRK